MKYCITTLVSSDYFQYYAPLFAYSAKRANPKSEVKIFVKGKLKPRVKEACDCEIVEDVFPKHPGKFNVNALRFLLPKHHFKGYKYVFFTDIDFIHVPHDPSLMKFFLRKMKKSNQCYAGYRGVGRKKRMAGGGFMVNQTWFNKTEKTRIRYLKYLKTHKISRKFDEEMLWAICKKAKLKLPKKQWSFVGKESYNLQYRNIHVGDFKVKTKVKDKALMKKLITKRTYKKFKELMKDEGFHNKMAVAELNDTVAQRLSVVRKYMRSR